MMIDPAVGALKKRYNEIPHEVISGQFGFVEFLSLNAFKAGNQLDRLCFFKILMQVRDSFTHRQGTTACRVGEFLHLESKQEYYCLSKAHILHENASWTRVHVAISHDTSRIPALQHLHGLQILKDSFRFLLGAESYIWNLKHVKSVFGIASFRLDCKVASTCNFGKDLVASGLRSNAEMM
jgi:hypothetical protein